MKEEESQKQQSNYLQGLPKSASTPLFITWEKQRRNAYVLRGCIGTLAPRPLSSAIGEYALTAALRDRRFEPIDSQEISELRVAVSLLVQYEECNHVHDWEVGLHGILIKFTDGPTANEYSATYLPEVAKEQGYVCFMRPCSLYIYICACCRLLLLLESFRTHIRSSYCPLFAVGLEKKL
jgi:uncharacterized protein (TIGR00296 family)